MDAESARNGWPNGSSEETTPISPTSSATSPALEMALLLQMHRQLLEMVGALIEQNQEILDAINDVADDPERTPKTYLDGTRI